MRGTAHFLTTWGHEILLVLPEEWRRRHATDPFLRDYEVLDAWHAKLALEALARERCGMAFLREQSANLLDRLNLTIVRMTRYAQWEEDQRCLQDLHEALGGQFSRPGELPDFARIYVCQRKRRAHAVQVASAQALAPPTPTPTRAKLSAPRPLLGHYIELQALTADKTPVPGVWIEVVGADGQMRTAQTGKDGRARVDYLTAGAATIRVVSLDCSMWKALAGPAARPTRADQSLRWHVVKPGECLSTVAHAYGLKGWKLLWDHANNEPLRKKRKSPHVLMPGDRVAVPGVTVHEIVRSLDETHTIEVQRAPDRNVRVRFQNLAGEPISELGYRYSVAGKQVAGSAPTDADGWLDERVPITTDVLELELEGRRSKVAVELGALHPIRDEDTKHPIQSGIGMRLCALGYAAGVPADTLTPQVEQALQTFQSVAMNRDEPSGEPDEETVSELARVALA